MNSHSLDLERSSSQYAAIADASQTGLDLSTDFTFEAWINLESLPSVAGGDFSIIAKDPGGIENRGYGWSIDTADDKLFVYWSDTGTSVGSRFKMDEAFDSNDLGVWIHVAVSVDISVPSAVFYKNGVATAHTAVSASDTTINNNAVQFCVGCLDGASNFFDGKLDEVRAWNDIRTAAEVLENHRKQLAGNEAGLVAYYKLNNNYLDETTNNNDLTSSGSPSFSTDVAPVDQIRVTAFML